MSAQHTPGPLTIHGGPFDGHIVRTARKDYACDNWIGWPGRSCGRAIRVGSQYVQGDPNPYRAGGFAHDRICMGCATHGGETETTISRAAIAKATGQ